MSVHWAVKTPSPSTTSPEPTLATSTSTSLTLRAVPTIRRTRSSSTRPKADDAITISSNNGVVTVTGLAEEVTISNFDTNDRIVINGLGGDDAIVASELEPGMQLTLNGGDGDDVLVGSAGNDILNGNAGDDVLIGGPGQDVLDGGTGNNIDIQLAVNNPPSGGVQAAALAGPVHGIELRHGRRWPRCDADRRSPRGTRSRCWRSHTFEATSSPGERCEH